MKTIEEFIGEVIEVSASLIAFGRWADRSPYSEDEARSRAYLITAQKYYKEKADVHLRDSVVVAGRGRRDEAIQALDKEGQMKEDQPGEGKVNVDRTFADRCVMLLIRLVAQIKLVHRHPEYESVWRYWTMVHGLYTGPSYGPQFDEALAHVEQKFDKPAYALGQASVKKEGDWTEEFKDEVYGLMYDIYRELDLREVLDPKVQEACRRLIKSWNEVHPAEEDILRIRCTQHHQVPQMNSAAAGAECGVCVINTAMETLRMQAKEKGPFEDMSTMGPYPGNSPAEQERMLMMSFQKPFNTKQVEAISDLIKTWHGRFNQVVNVGDNSLHSGGFPVMGEVYHRREVTDKVHTFDSAFEQLRHRLLNKENFEGDTLYIRVAPTIEKVYDFDSTKDVYCGMARFSYTVKSGTVVIDKDKFMQK